jgi:hypothetical protein
VVEGRPVHDTVAAVTPNHGEAVEPKRAHDLDLIGRQTCLLSFT